MKWLVEQIENFSCEEILLTIIEGAYEPTTLTGTFGVDPSNITYRARRMESQGLVERCSDGSDGRVVFLRLTNEGLALLREAQLVHVQRGRPRIRVK